MKSNKRKIINKLKSKKMMIGKLKEGKAKKIIMKKKIRKDLKNKTNLNIKTNLP